MTRKHRKPVRSRTWARVTARNLDMGWHGKKGGRAVTFELHDDDEGYLGTLGISTATVYWQGCNRKKWAEISTKRLEELFEDYY